MYYYLVAVKHEYRPARSRANHVLSIRTKRGTGMESCRLRQRGSGGSTTSWIHQGSASKPTSFPDRRHRGSRRSRSGNHRPARPGSPHGHRSSGVVSCRPVLTLLLDYHHPYRHPGDLDVSGWEGRRYTDNVSHTCSHRRRVRLVFERWWRGQWRIRTF